jgi:hypothetical protein
MFEAPMAAQYARCEESIVSDDGVASSSDRSANCGDQNSLLGQLSLSGGHSALYDVQRNPAHKEEVTQVKNESENPTPESPQNTFPSEQMVQLSVTPTSVPHIRQEPPSTEVGDKSKIMEGGIAPRTRRPHRASRPGDLQRGRNRTRHLLRVNKSVEAATLEGASQKQVQPEAPKAIPPLPLDCDDSNKATEAKVGFRRRQCTRPLLRENSSKSVVAATLEGASQKQVQPEAPKAIPPLPLDSQQDMGDDSKQATEAKVGFRRRQCTRPLLRENSSRRKIVSPAPPAA